MPNQSQQTSSNPTPEILDELLSERLAIIYRSLPLIIIVNILASILFAYSLHDLFSLDDLLLWLFVVVIVSTLRTVSYFSYQRHLTPQLLKRYANFFVYGSGASGLVLGLAAIFFFPGNNLPHQYFILVFFAGMGVAALSILHAYLPALYVYLILLLSPIAIKMISLQDSTHLSIGIMSLAFLAGLMHFGLSLNRSLRQTLKLRFKNLDLIQQLKQQKHEADVANAAKSRFLAAASHDLRQPLHALTLFTSALSDSEQNPANHKLVSQIMASALTLEQMFNTLLDMSRLEAGTMAVNKQNFPLASLFQRIINDLEPQANAKNLRILTQRCEYSVYSDPILLEQIVRNYIANAIRYTEQGTISIDCEEQQDSLTIHVRDTGIGIPTAELENVFEEFHQLGNPERNRNNGLGLGLSIVKRAAQLLGHNITVSSEYTKGSVFSVTVDKADVSLAVPETADARNENMIKKPGGLFLVIDDEKSIREGMLSRLETWGYEAITAENLQQALTALDLRDCVPDGIVADYRLRDHQNGVDAIRAIREHCGTDIPALLITGDIAAAAMGATNEGEFQVLQKPVAPGKLRAFLRNAQLGTH